MPELAELKLTAEYVNKMAEGKVFHGVAKNPEHKGEEITIDFPFVIEAQSRGKELMLTISTAPDFVIDQVEVKHLMMGMGMSGHFKWVEPGSVEKHAHLVFKTDNGTLAFVDVRRFGKWKWGFWNKDRGPDPISNYQAFVKNVTDNLHKKDFDKPICEVLMNQCWFNGIGNYLRAEILYRVCIDPFMSGREALTKCPEIFEECKSVSEMAYQLGGGELKDWKNPFETIEEVNQGWSEFMLCYGNPKMATKMDSNGRRFWYDPIWNISEDNWCHYSGMPSPQAYANKVK
jgi:endonuclease VIII-like 1